MKRLLFLWMLAGIVTAGYAQEGNLYLSSRQPPIQISVGALYQSYTEDGSDIAEFSVPLVLSAPLGSGLGLSLVASQASASGDNLESVSGLSDAQVGLSYYQRVGQGSVVASLGVNLPSGKRELTATEFQTSIFLSQHFYNFRVPGFGQGLNLSPGVVLAYPVSEQVVLGIGVSYQLKGGYKPIEGMTEEYTPGDEVLATGGFDVRIGRTSNVSADVTYALYGSDMLGDSTIFDAGDKLRVTAQWLSYLQANELRFFVRFRSQAKSSRPAALGATATDLRTLPAQVSILGSYRHHLNTSLSLGILAQGRFFGETDLFEKRTLFDVGLAPEIALSRGVALRLRFLYTLGDITGFEAGGGLVVSL